MAREQPPQVDLLTRDYAGFRALMLDRIRELVPDWTEDSPADLGVTLVEALAYAADHLSYRQDAVAGESWIATARLGSSIRRHLRLTGHQVDEGAGSRLWAFAEVHARWNEPIGLPTGTLLLPRAVGLPVSLSEGSDAAGSALAQSNAAFSTHFPVTLSRSSNAVEVPAGGANGAELAPGTTRIEIAGPVAVVAAGQVVLIEDRLSGYRQCARVLAVEHQTHTGNAVVELHADDALRERLRPGTFTLPGGQTVAALVMRGNMLLADHGTWATAQLQRVATATFRPFLPARVQWHQPVATGDPHWSARSVLQQPARLCMPAIELIDVTSGTRWLPVRDLLGRSATATVFMVEPHNGGVQLRFGDGEHGQRPHPGTEFIVRYRSADLYAGQIAAGSLGHVISAQPAAITTLFNPAAASAARAPESDDSARLLGARAGLPNTTLATMADLENAVRACPGIADASARRCRLGAGDADLVWLQADSDGVTDQHLDPIRNTLQQRVLASSRLMLRRAATIGMDVEVRVAVHSRAAVALVERQVDTLLLHPQRGLPLTAPHRFRLGEWPDLEDLAAPIRALVDVREVHISASRTLGKLTAELARSIPHNACVCVRNDPARPALGRLHISVTP